MRRPSVRRRRRKLLDPDKENQRLRDLYDQWGRGEVLSRREKEDLFLWLISHTHMHLHTDDGTNG